MWNSGADGADPRRRLGRVQARQIVAVGQQFGQLEPAVQLVADVASVAVVAVVAVVAGVAGVAAGHRRSAGVPRRRVGRLCRTPQTGHLLWRCHF